VKRMTNSLDILHESFKTDQRTGRLVRFGAMLSLLVFGFWTVRYLEIPLGRLLNILGPLGTMLTERMFPPDLVYASSWKILASVIETIEMSLLGAFFGTVLAIPLAWWAAWNITPSRTILYPFARAVIVFCRSLPTLILGILLVTIFVFGPFAGVLALIIGTIGFAGKLMAEQAEAIDMGPVEAVRSTGAGALLVFIYGILPQVKPGWMGIITYNWDARLRSSTILGFVGAGGIGLHLREQISQLEYHAALGIITIIVVLVIISEAISHFLRQWLR